MAHADGPDPLLHVHIDDAPGGAQHEAGQVGVGVGVFDDFILDEFFHHGEVGEFEVGVLAQKPGGDAVIDGGAEVLEGGLGLFAVAGDGDIVVAVEQGVHQVPEPVRRTLLVVVDEDDVVAFGVVAAAHQGVVAASVLGQVDDGDFGVPGGDLPEDSQDIVGGAVVDGHDLVVEAGPLADDLADLVDHEPHRAFAGVAGDDKGYQLFGCCVIIHVL